MQKRWRSPSVSGHPQQSSEVPRIPLITMRLSCSVSWWVVPYIRCIAVMCWLTGLEPNVDRVTTFAMRGIKIVIKDDQ